MFGRFSEVARRRPVDLVQPDTDLPPAPYAAVEADLDPDAPHGRVALRLAGLTLAAVCDGRALALEISGPGGPAQRHRSRRHGAVRRPSALALTLTGPVVTGWVREAGRWLARAQVDLADPAGAGTRWGPVDVHDPDLLATMTAEGERSGVMGQLGLRDLRVVTEADGTAYRSGAREVLLTATSAGPCGFRTAHTSVWVLDCVSLELRHRGDLFARRPGADGRIGIYGDHAVHLLHDDGVDGRTEDGAGGSTGGGAWLLAASTWGDFDREHEHVAATLARSGHAPLVGTHVLDAELWALPTTGLRSVGVWDPQLVRVDDGWLVAYVSATRFFAFQPVLAAGPDLDTLTLRGAATDRVFTEGPVLVRDDDTWLLAASDGRRGRRAHPVGYPLFSTAAPPSPATTPATSTPAPAPAPALIQVGRIPAAYPTNLPWPTVLDLPDPPAGGRLLISFDGTPAGGRLVGYGTHGDVVIQQEVAPMPSSQDDGSSER